MDTEFTFNEKHKVLLDDSLFYYWSKYAPDTYQKAKEKHSDSDAFERFIQQYCREHKKEEYDVTLEGLAELFNDGVVLSPAFVNWLTYFGFIEIDEDDRVYAINDLLKRIKDPQMCVTLLKYLIHSAKIIYRYQTKNAVAYLKALLPTYEEAAKVRAKELAKQAAEQRKKIKREKPELSLSLDEMIDYVQNINSDGAQSIYAMLLWAATHKEGWLSASTIKKIDAINKKSDIYVDNKGTTNIIPNATIHQ
jgi:hypothetical protein